MIIQVCPYLYRPEISYISQEIVQILSCSEFYCLKKVFSCPSCEMRIHLILSQPNIAGIVLSDLIQSFISMQWQEFPNFSDIYAIPIDSTLVNGIDSFKGVVGRFLFFKY